MSTSLQQLARKIAEQEGISPSVFEALVNQESQWNPHAKSPMGAIGLTQLMPGTAAGLGVSDPYDPVQNLRGGARYLKQQLRAFGGNYSKALAAYNAGPGAVQKYGGVPPYAETRNYVSSILGHSRSSHVPSTPYSSGTMGSNQTRVLTRTVPGQSFAAERGAAIQQFLGSGNNSPQNNLDFALQIRSLQDTPSRTVVTRQAGTTPAASSQPARGGSSLPSGVASFEGKKVAAWIAPILRYARSQGWTGTVNSGYRSYADQQRIYNSGVRPAARPGTSNHEFTGFPGGAVDVSDAEQLSRILQGSKYARTLVWAGSKDPVHFSHPHNGGY